MEMRRLRNSALWATTTRLENLTPHEVAVMVGDSIIRVPPSGRVVRLNSHCDACGEVMGIPVSTCVEGKPRNLPEPEEGVVYLVSSVVAKQVKRWDVLCPDTSEDGAIRDGNGYIVAVKRLQSFVD
jgi:hypothetical protein